MPVVKDVCHLQSETYFVKFHQLLIVEVLWSQPVLQLSTGKQMVVTWREIRTVRRMVKQLPVEMLQLCLSASSCMQTSIVMEERYPGGQHSMPFVLNGPMRSFLALRKTLLTLLWSPVARILSSAHISCPVQGKGCHQLSGRQRLLKLYKLIWRMCVHPLLWLNFAFNIHKWNSGFITCYS
jgi:hypothetical protein